MKKTILITGSTDGIGLGAAKRLASQGHTVLLHGRNAAKLDQAEQAVRAQQGGGGVERFQADLSRLADVEAFAQAVSERAGGLDVLINNAGVYQAADPVTADGLDVRFVVNAIAPFLLTQRLLPQLGASGRVINVSSAAQSPVDLQALAGRGDLPDGSAYAQSKLALTMWSTQFARSLGADGPAIVAVNPGSMLGTKMVQDGFGVEGNDVEIGVDILTRAALSEEFTGATGKYYDNDEGRFGPPHPDALDPHKTDVLVAEIQRLLEDRV